MVRSFALIAAFALAACATPRTPPPPVIKTVTVTVPVPTPCVAASDVPVRPTPLPAARPADVGDEIRMLLAKLLEYAGPGEYADKVVAILPGCVAK